MKALILIVLFSIACNSYADISVITGHGFVLNNQGREILIDFSNLKKVDINELLKGDIEGAMLYSNTLNELIDTSLPNESETKRKILIDVDMIDSIKLKKGSIDRYSDNDF